jgi:hypothetical protein
MKVTYSSETLVGFQRTKRLYMPTEDGGTHACQHNYLNKGTEM